MAGRSCSVSVLTGLQLRTFTNALRRPSQAMSDAPRMCVRQLPRLWRRRLRNADNRDPGPTVQRRLVRAVRSGAEQAHGDDWPPRIVRLVVGNPLIMKRMAAIVPDPAAYAPVTILVDERANVVHL